MLSPAQLAAHLNIGRSTVYELIERGELPAIRVGRQWRTSQDQLEEFLHNHLKGDQAESSHEGTAA